MTKKERIIQEYAKNTSQRYIDVYNSLKDEIPGLTYNYVKRILHEYNAKKIPGKAVEYQGSEKGENSNQGGNTRSSKNVPKIEENRNGTLSIIKRKRKVLFVSDIHAPFHDIEAVRKAFEVALDERVNTIVLGGDIMDNHALSFWKDRKRADFVAELELMKSFLNEVRETFINSKIYYLWGNHELRYERFLLSHAEKLFGIEELQLENLLKLSDFQISKIDNRDQMQQFGRPFAIGKLYYLHGHEIKASYGAVNIARNMYLKAQDNIIFGHFHQTQEYIQKDINGSVKGAWAVGCLCDMSPDYSIINNWNSGFAIIEYEDNGDFTVYNRKIINGKVV